MFWRCPAIITRRNWLPACYHRSVFMEPSALRIQLTRAQTFHQLPANSFSSGTDQFDWAGGVPVFSGACRIIINNEFLYRSSSILSQYTGKGCTIPDEKVRPPNAPATLRCINHRKAFDVPIHSMSPWSSMLRFCATWMEIGLSSFLSNIEIPSNWMQIGRHWCRWVCCSGIQLAEHVLLVSETKVSSHCPTEIAFKTNPRNLLPTGIDCVEVLKI